MTDATARRTVPPYELAKHVRKARYFLFEEGSPQDVHGLRVVFGGLEYCGADYSIDRKSYPLHCLEIIVDGQGTADLGDGPQAIHAGSMFLQGPDLPCKIMTDRKAPIVKYFVTFRAQDAADVNGVALGRHRICHSSAVDGIIVLAESLHQEGVRQADGAHAICNHLLQVLLLRFDRIASLASVRDEHAWRVFEGIRNTIDQRFMEFQTLGDLCSAVGLNVSYVSRLFQRYHVTTPYKYLQHRKIEFAAALLRREGRSVAEAASLAGYDDPFHFSRVFKQVKGFSPVHYRGNACGG